MTEKEKMLAHQMYDANYNKELHDERIAAKELCWEYNQLRPSNEEGQRAVLKKLLGKTGENFYITAPFWCDYGYNIELGENFYANHNLVILDCAKVKFGDNVFVAPDCGFHTAGHPIDFERRTLLLDLPGMAIVAVLVYLLSLDGALQTWEGIPLVVAAVIYTVALG